jgi:hypothetical protein
MLTRRILGSLFVVLLASIDAGCRPKPTDTAPDARPADGSIRVEVRNNLLDAGPITVFIEPASEVRTQLGSLAAGETRTFVFMPTELNRVVRMIALSSMGQTIVSTGITVPRGSNLTWDVRINSLRLIR